MKKQCYAVLLVLLLCLSFACGPKSDDGGFKAQVEKDIDAAAEALASAISRLDVEGATYLFSDAPGTKYISDGAYIPKKALKAALSDFYGSLLEMNFAFDKKELSVLGSNIAVLTSWARYTAVTKEGQKLDEKALYTSVYLREKGKWKIFQAHKSLIQ